MSTPLPPVALVVEDDPDQREEVVKELRATGYHVVEAASSATACRLLKVKENAPALAILDFELGFSPRDTAEPILLELHKSHPNCTVIVWSENLTRDNGAKKRITRAKPVVTMVDKDPELDYLLDLIQRMMHFKFGDLELNGPVVVHTHHETGHRSLIVNDVAAKLMTEAQKEYPSWRFVNKTKALGRLRHKLALLGSTVTIKALGGGQWCLIEIDDGELAELKKKAELWQAHERDRIKNRRKR